MTSRRRLRSRARTDNPDKPTQLGGRWATTGMVAGIVLGMTAGLASLIVSVGIGKASVLAAVVLPVAVIVPIVARLVVTFMAAQPEDRPHILSALHDLFSSRGPR